jgi:hypothetical protein
MLDHVKRKVIRAAQAPDRDAQQQHNPKFGMFHDEQGGGGQTRGEKEDTFRFNPTRICEVFHTLMAAPTARSLFGTRSALFAFCLIRLFELLVFEPYCVHSV